ncbi:MAG: TRIC cation channel family protein [Schumannella sp.]
MGTTKALAFGLPEIPAIFLGVITAVGGSILRDLLLNVPISLMSVGRFHAVAAPVGATSRRDGGAGADTPSRPPCASC